MAEIGVHDDDEVPSREFQPVYIGGAQTEFSCARLENDTRRSVEILKLLGDGKGSVRRGIIDNNKFPVEIAVWQG